MTHCARCNKPLPPTRPRIYSRFTKSHYCTDIDACTKRMRRRNRAEQLRLEVRR